jgi:hypothetical protein
VMEKYLRDSIPARKKALEEKMLKANLINKYVYTIDSVLRLRDRRIYNAKMEKKHIADSTKAANELALYNKWINFKLRSKKRK